MQRQKPKRGELHQWYKKHLRSLQLSDGDKLATFRYNGQTISVTIMQHVWFAALAKHETKIKLMNVVRDIVQQRGR